MRSAPVLALLLLLAACEGPVGPAGENGSLALESLTLRLPVPASWTNNGPVEQWSAPAPLLTAQDIEAGFVVAYTDAKTPGSWMPLPLEFALATLTVVYEPGLVTVVIIKDQDKSLAYLYEGYRVRIAVAR